MNLDLTIERQKLNLIWNVRFNTGEIPIHPEFQLFPNPKAAQRNAWVSHKLMTLKHSS